MKNTGKIILTAFIAIAGFSSCEKKQEEPPIPTSPVKWAWVAGSDKVSQIGTYGIKGTAAATNVPGAREDGVTWTGADDKLWLFGGYGYDATGYPGRMNDLWRFDPTATAWTWISGSDIRNQPGAYGLRGVADPSNVPGARNGAASWTDAGGNFWLFGGLGHDSAGDIGQMNDLWKFDPATVQWAWISGSSVRYQPGVYGTKGVADPANAPGARVGAAVCVDGSGNFWLFGGYGYDAAGEKGELNDLWKYDPSTLQWTWISGVDAVDQIGVYGTRGEADPANLPGGRYEALAWADPTGLFWLFGGDGIDSAGATSKLNDLWKFDPATQEWTWSAGSKMAGYAGTYGDLNVGTTANIPGGRYGAISWVHANGTVYLFGGDGLDSVTAEGWLSDLWKFDPATLYWTWVSGYITHGHKGAYGTQGTAAPLNIPGGRYYPFSWITSQGVRWQFGGYGLDSEGTGGWLNDLWRQE